MTVQLKGELESGRIWLFGKELFPDKSLKVRNHSPEGFAWGYTGSGPAQLALALCIELFGEKRAQEIYQEFKSKYIATLPQTDFENRSQSSGSPQKHRYRNMNTMKQSLRIQFSHAQDLLRFCERGDAAIVRLGRQNFIVNLVTVLEAYAVRRVLADQDESLLDGHFTLNLLHSIPDLTISDQEMISNLVELRNSIVHGDGCKNITIAEVRECMDLANKIIHSEPM